MLCLCAPINANTFLSERRDSQESDEGEAAMEVARLTVHEDDMELYWPLSFSICYPVWQAASVLNTPFYPFPLICPIDKAKVVFKNMMYKAEDLPNQIVAMDGNSKPLLLLHSQIFSSKIQPIICSC